jgi:hypothetical protein
LILYKNTLDTRFLKDMILEQSMTITKVDQGLAVALFLESNSTWLTGITSISNHRMARK